ncbi:MAG: phosphate-selective porin OprO/OprP [Halieaceae bacterium]|jgi:phosphate-selective porin OprO/OprP
MHKPASVNRKALPLLCLLSAFSGALPAADQALLDILLGNGVITPAQHQLLMQKESLHSEDILGPQKQPVQKQQIPVEHLPGPLDPQQEAAIAEAVARALEATSPVVASHGSPGFSLATRDDNWQTNLQWRAQFRYSNPIGSDPRQLDDFANEDSSSFEPRRLRMKIGGYGFQPWLKYYFEVDLQSARDVDADASSSGARVIDWRIDVAKWDWGALRIGQWKVDLNRERVDSSGRQQFVERSIVNRVFTVDRQIGIQLRGHLFEGTPADMRYYAGVFNGEGRGVKNDDEGHLYMARLQWNFLSRDLLWRQTDVEYTEQPTGSLAFAGFTNEGSCTRWSSSGCGNLDGFLRPAFAAPGQYNIHQYVEEFAFKYRGLSLQQEYHQKRIKDNLSGGTSELTGLYAQAGYFFHKLIPAWPAPLELAARYAYVDEPNELDRLYSNTRKEYTLGANWFFAGHNNKLTLDYSHLTLDDGLLGLDDSENRLRLQWDISF